MILGAGYRVQRLGLIVLGFLVLLVCNMLGGFGVWFGSYGVQL